MKNRILTLLFLVASLFFVGCEKDEGYNIGDYYNDGAKEGIIFWLNASRTGGKILSLEESLPGVEWAVGAAALNDVTVGAIDQINGANNMAVIKSISGWRNSYPAFSWCADLGSDWYLPSIKELEQFTLNNAVLSAVNKGLKAKRAQQIYTKTSSSNWHWYWSSTERIASGIFNTAHLVDMFFVESSYERMGVKARVRAVACFGEGAVEAEKSSYKVGDYYSKGGKSGVVCYVDSTGQHGKLVSMTESPYMPWATGVYPSDSATGATSSTDGEANTAKIKQLSNWMSDYPAFAWCASLGSDWYLPSINELEQLILTKSVITAVNKTLKAKGGKEIAVVGDNWWYWSSTESDNRNAKLLELFGGYSSNGSKAQANYVRAMATF